MCPVFALILFVQVKRTAWISQQQPFINTKLLEHILANIKNISYVALINVSHIKVTVASEMKHKKTVSSNPVWYSCNMFKATKENKEY